MKIVCKCPEFIKLQILLFFITFPAAAFVTPPTGHQKFYILKIEDHRSIKPRILAGNQTASSSSFIQLPDGELKSIQKLLLSVTSSDNKLRPVIISVKKTNIEETSQKNGRIDGKVSVALSFQLATKDERVNLVDYEGAAVYSRAGSDHSVPAAALNRTLMAGLTYFTQWIDREAPKNIKLATGVKFHFKDYLEQHPDTVYYSPQRSLNWSDFKDSPKSNGFGAEIFAGFGFDQYTSVVDGVVHVSLITRVFVPKSASWVHADNLNRYALNHEQRHFDIAKIISEQFKEQILAADLTLDNWEGYLGPHYLETLRAMNRMQDQYDRESRHGMDKQWQETWNKKIDADLKRFGLK